MVLNSQPFPNLHCSPVLTATRSTPPWTLGGSVAYPRWSALAFDFDFGPGRAARVVRAVPPGAKGSVFGRWMNNLKRDHITPQLKKKGMKWNGWHAFRRGLATNLHDMGVPTKVIQRICRHADEATTKKHYIHATEPGVQRGMRKLEASITREKYERQRKRLS